MLALFAFIYFQRFFQCEGSSIITTVENPDARCRNERQIYLPYEAFRSDACARCYKYMPPVAFSFKLHYTKELGTLCDPRVNTTHYVDPLNVSEMILNTFTEESFAEKWISCCRAAWDCCNTMATAPTLFKDTLYCPRTWDGWQCWPDTQAGKMADLPCQEHIYFENGPPSCTTNQNSAEKYKDEFDKIVADNDLTPEQIYNADETGLLWKCLPTSTLAGRGEKAAKGLKKNKDRLTVLLCANASGNHRVTPFVIGKSAKPRAFKNVTHLPVQYKAQSNAWMTAALFKDWFFSPLCA
ncbi:Jerky [Araneus ventricosus]|uniref:Jerky n=1 Tax=Araneus ventricosus TaxID=182803 RepID=A0A4Y2EH68_ARAVE|nr:Jerky [Araneus ventricosus]